MKQIPQPPAPRLNLQLLQHRRLEMRIPRLPHLLLIHRLRRIHMRIHELQQIGLQLLGAIRDVKQGHGNS